MARSSRTSIIPGSYLGSAKLPRARNTIARLWVRSRTIRTAKLNLKAFHVYRSSGWRFFSKQLFPPTRGIITLVYRVDKEEHYTKFIIKWFAKSRGIFNRNVEIEWNNGESMMRIDQLVKQTQQKKSVSSKEVMKKLIGCEGKFSGRLREVARKSEKHYMRRESGEGINRTSRPWNGELQLKLFLSLLVALFFILLPPPPPTLPRSRFASACTHNKRLPTLLVLWDRVRVPLISSIRGMIHYWSDALELSL